MFKQSGKVDVMFKKKGGGHGFVLEFHRGGKHLDLCFVLFLVGVSLVMTDEGFKH